jgi:hypothetical protein
VTVTVTTNATAIANNIALIKLLVKEFSNLSVGKG